MQWQARQSRRGVLKIAVACVPVALLSACQAAATPAPTAAPATVAPVAPAAVVPTRAPAQAPAAASASTSSWDQMVAAAKVEGKVSILVAPGDVYNQIFSAFQDRYGISFELGVSNGPAVGPKVNDERTAGQFLWDVAALAPGLLYQSLKPLNALDPIRPALVLPEVTDDSKWIGGLDAGYVDTERTYGLAFTSQVLWTVRVNRSLVSEADFNALDQILDPRWKGMIAMSDPRIPSAGSLMTTTFMAAKGQDALRQLLTSQNPTISQDRRQVAEWLVRGVYPLGMGVESSAVSDLAAGGADVSIIQPLTVSDSGAATVGSGSGAVGLVNKAPHPNAAQLAINWLLSQEGQTVWAKAIGYNSRRTDVPPVDPDGVVDPQRQYIDLNTEASVPTRAQELTVAKEALQ